MGSSITKLALVLMNAEPIPLGLACLWNGYGTVMQRLCNGYGTQGIPIIFPSTVASVHFQTSSEVRTILFASKEVKVTICFLATGELQIGIIIVGKFLGKCVRKMFTAQLQMENIAQQNIVLHSYTKKRRKKILRRKIQ